MSKVNGNNNVSAEYKIVNGKKVKKQEQSKNQKQVFNNKGQKTPQKPKDSAIKQEVYKKSGYQLKDTKDRNKIIQLKVNGKIRSYKTVGTLTTGGRILVQDEKGAYHVVSHTKDNKLIMLKDDYAKNKIFYESTSSEHKVKYGKKNYVITNSKRDRHGRMSAIDENGKRVVLSSDGKELKTGYVEAEDQKDNMNDYIAKQTKGKSKAEADKIRQQILSGNSSYSNKGVLRFKASNGEVWYYDTKRKTYVKYAEKEAQAIIKNLDKGATENWLLFRTSLGTDYELLKNTNAQIIDPEVLNKVNKHYSAEYSKKVDKNAQYGSGKYKTAYEAFLASEIGDDEVYQFNATLVKNNAITDQTRRNEILQTNLTKVGSRANRLAAADAASRKEDYQTLQDAAEEENKKKNYKAPFKGSDALQTYIYGVNKGDVQEVDDFNTTLIDPKEDMIDRDEIVKIKAETGVLWAKKGKYDKAFEAQDGEIVDKMFALQDANGKASLNVKELKAKAKGFQGEYLMFAKPELFTEQELADKAVSMLTVALDQFDFIEKQNSLQSESVLHNLSHSRSDVVASAMSDNGTKNASKNAIEASISKAYTLIRNDKVLNLVKQKMGDKFNLLQKKEQAMFKTNTFANVTTKNDNVKSNLSAEEVAQNKYVVSWLKNQLEDLERDKKMNEAKEGWKQTAVDAMRTSLRAGETRESLANKYDLIKSNMARLEAAAEGKLVDASGKPVSFEDAMKNLGETGIQALEQANADYQTAQQTGEFMVDMAVLALPLPKGFNAANTVIKMGNALYKVISKSDKACKVIKITQEAIKGSKIYEVATKVATTNPKLVENTRKVATIMDSSATGAMHMAGKTVVLDASNIATSREGFTSDRISEMNQKTQSAAVFGGMGGAIGGTTAVASEFVSSAGAKYTVHGVGLVADLMGAAGLMTAESHGETNFWDNLRCVNPDGSFNFEQASMTAMMIFGHLHGMSAVRGKVKPHVELQADGTFKAKLGDNVLTLNKDGIWSDSASGREFRLAENKNGKAELTELTKKEVVARHLEQPVAEGVRANSTRHSEAPAEESRGTSTQQIKSFKERINNAKTREELNAIRSEIKKTDLTVQERNELMKESLKVQREWGQAPERRQIVNMAAEKKQAVLEALNKPAETDPASHSELDSESKQPATDEPVGAKEAQVTTETDKIEYVHDENGNVIKEIHKGDNLTKEILKDAEGNVLGSDEYVYDSQGLQRTIHKNAQGKIVAIYDNVNKQMVFDIREKSVNNNVQADSKHESQKPAESLPENWEIPENNMTTFRRNKNAVTDVKNINPEDVSVAGTYNGYSHFAGPTEKSLGVNGDIRSFATKNKGLAVAYDKAKNVTVITTGVCDAFNRPGGIISIKVKGQVSEADGIALVKNLEKANFIPERMSTIATPQELGVLGRRIQQETAKFFNEKQTNSAFDTKKTNQTPDNASESEAIQPKPETNATSTESNRPSLKVNDKRIQKATTIEEAKKLAEQYDNVEVIERNLGNKAYDIKVTEENGSKTTKIVKGKVVSFEEHEYNSAGKETKGTYKDAEGNVSSSRETEYNSAGNVVKRTLKDSKGKLVSSEEYEYGNDGNKIKVTFINYNNDYNNTVKRLTEVSYNDAGKVVKRIHKNSEGKIESSTETEYDSAGNKTKDTYIEYSEGKIESSTETEYDSAGKETKDTYIEYSEGKISRFRETEYDSAGKETKDTLIKYSEGKVTSSEEYEYNKRGSETKGTYKDAEGKITSSYEKEYNDSNHITKEIHRDSEGKITSFEEYEYNNTGYETKKTSKDSDGRIISSKEYEYDANNNVVKITEKNANGQIISVKDGKGNPIEIPEPKTDPASHSEAIAEESQVTKTSTANDKNPVIASEGEAIQTKQKPLSTEVPKATPEQVAQVMNSLTVFSSDQGARLAFVGKYSTECANIAKKELIYTVDEGKSVKYFPDKDISLIDESAITKEDTGRIGTFRIAVKGRVSEADAKALMEHLFDKGVIKRDADGRLLTKSVLINGNNEKLGEAISEFLANKKLNSQNPIGHSERVSGIEQQVKHTVVEESRVTSKSPTEKSVTEKPATEKPVNASEGEAIQTKQNTAEKTPVTTTQKQRTGNTQEQAAVIYNEEVKTAGVTPVQQTKAQQLELERLQTLVQSNEGKAILADAMKDPNFGKPLSERVPDEGFKMTEDGRLQIEVDGVVYTQRNEGDFRLVSSDGKILEDHIEGQQKSPSATDNPNLTRLYRNGDGKIFGIENQYGAIVYENDSLVRGYYPAGKPNTILDLSLGRATENYITTDNVGRVLYNTNPPQFSAFSEYHSTTIQGSGHTMSDSNIVRDLNQAIQDVNLKNTTFSIKKGRQKAYEDVRTQIENAYKDNKLTGQDYENLVANLNSKAEKSGGLIVRETRYRQHVAKIAEAYETNRDLLSDKIDKVATKSDYDNMVVEINEAFKSGKIDREAARVLNETLDAKGELIEGVETLSQKKAKIEKQVGEIETAQRIEAAEAKSRPHAELLDEYLAESGENLSSEIGSKEYYDEALSTIDRGVKNGSIEPQKAEVLRTQLKEQLAKLESESNQPVTEPPVIVEESRGAESNQSANVEPKAGKKFDISTDDIPTKLSDMQEFVEKNSLNALNFKVDDNTILYSIKNDETGGVMHVQFTDGKRSNMTIVKANDLQTYIEFTEDGVTPSKVRTDFIDNGKIFTKVEDMITGQVAFEEPVVMNGKRSPAGLAIENDSPLVKRFNEGSIDLEGKFTPKEVNEGSGVKESLSELSEESQVKDTPETENPVVSENETPKFEEVETNEGLQLRHKVGDENSYEFFNPETLKWEPTTKQFFDERVARDGVKAKPVEKTIGESATGNTQKKAEQTYKEEMNNVEPTSTAQVKNLEKYDIMFQSKEGKALLDKAKKDPNFGKIAEERVPSDKIVKDADGNIQSIEIDGVTYTRNEQGEYVNEKGDSQIQIETPDQDILIIDPKVDKRIIIDKENNKILRINSDDMTIEYDSNGQPERVSSLGNEIYLSTGNSSQDFGSATVDPTGRVIKNDAFFIDINERKYCPNKQEGYRYSDWGENAKGEEIDYKIRKETEDSLSKLIKDAQLENRGLRTTKKGRQKAYDDVRNQIEDAYNNSKIDRETADNLHAELNEKAKANGLETQETPTMVAEREALAKWNEQADTIKGDLMSVIEKSVDSQVAHDQMVEKIGEACKNGEIDMKRANELYDALEAKANSIDGVESLAKKAERINAELKAHEIKFAEESQGQKEYFTKESLEKDIEALKQGDDISEYLGKLDEAKKQGVLNDDEVYELTQKATKKVSEVEIPEPENTPDGFLENPTKPKQLEKKTIEEILGEEQAPKTADEAKKYAEEHEDAEFVASDDPNNCDMLFLDKEQNNIIYYNKDGVQAYREYNPSEAIEQRDTSLYSDGTVYRVETRTVDGNLKVEAYDPVGNLERKELYDTDNGVWALHEITFDSEGNMTGARKVVQNKETGTWEGATEYKYEYNAEKNRFEQKNEKDEVVSTVKYDEATEHWAEFDAEGKAIHEINKPEPVVESESAPAGESTPVSENSETANAKPSKISMFDKLFHRNKARLEKEVASGEEKIGDYKFNTVKDENGYVRTKTNNNGKIEGKEYFNAKGKKFKTETFDTDGNRTELTEGNVTTKYYANDKVRTVKYPNHKTVEFVYDENGKLTRAEYTEEISKAREFARSITAEENEFGEYEYDTIKRRTNYEYNSAEKRFELKNEKGDVVGTATFDPETRHWVEDGQYSSDLAPKTTNVSRGEGRFRARISKATKNIIDKFRSNKPKNEDGTTIPKKFRGRDDVTYDRETKKYTERTEKNGVTIETIYDSKGRLEQRTAIDSTGRTERIYDSKGRLVQEVDGNKTKYYNPKGEVIAEQEITEHGIKRTEKSKDYDLDVLINSQGEGEKITIKYHEDKKGNTAEPEEFTYNKDSKVFENKGPEGTVFKTVEYDAKNHKWTIKDAEGKKIDSQNNMKESHIKRNIGIGAGVLALGALAYGIAPSGDDKKVEQPTKPTAKPAPKKTTPAPKAETKVTLDGKEGTIAEDGTLTLDGKPYPKDTDGTYTIGDKKYKVEDGKLVEVVDTPDDNGETGGAAPDESPEVKGTIDGKEYTINSDGSATIGGDMYEKESDGYYHTEDGSIYGIGEDGKLVKIDKTQAGSAGSATQTGSDSAQAGSAGSATQTGSDSAQAGNTGATSQQTGNTNTTGNNTHVTAPAQPADSSASTRTTGTTHNDTSVTTRHTNVPAEESRVNSSRPSEQSAESRRTGNTPVTGVTDPTEAQKQDAKTLQDEISSISTQADVKAFFAKAISAYNAGKITLMQLDVLKTQVENHVGTLNEAIKIQNEQDAIQKPEFGLGEVTTPQELQRKEKQEITPMERMELTEKIRKATDRKDIEEIQQEMRQYKVFPGRKNLRRAYKAKLRAIKHQDEPQKVEKYNKKFEKRMDKIEDSKVYKNDKDQINRENFQKMKYFDDIIKRPKDFDDGIFNA